MSWINLFTKMSFFRYKYLVGVKAPTPKTHFICIWLSAEGVLYIPVDKYFNQKIDGWIFSGFHAFFKILNYCFWRFRGLWMESGTIFWKKFGHTDTSNYLTCFRYILLSKIILSRKKEEKGARWPLLEIF